jgi:hypothetical protein
METTNRFHEAKMKLGNALEEFHESAKADDRDVKEELLDVIADEFGLFFLDGEIF